MSVTFKLKIRHQGASQVESYVGKDGKVISKKIAGAIEDTAYDAAGQMIAEKMLEASKRNLFLAAMFFQRVVSRTPMDEDYMTGMNEREKITMHKADNDYVRDAWTASYNNFRITAKELREGGCEFLKFNDRNEVKKIYNVFLSFLGKGNKGLLDGSIMLKGIRIENKHERFPMLEYGEYEHDGTVKVGEHFKHGVKGGYSVQAPVGMLRLTQQEFEETAFNIPTEELMTNSRKWQKNLVKSGGIKRVTKLLKGKSRIGLKEMAEIAKEYNGYI